MLLGLFPLGVSATQQIRHRAYADAWFPIFIDTSGELGHKKERSKGPSH
jgi:hypothetical protein